MTAILHRANQFRNMLRTKLLTPGRPKWVYIYGHYRGGTSYAMRQVLRASRCGVGDWMLYQFADAFEQANRRESERTFHVEKLTRSFRSNIFRSAPPGGGQNLDIVVKQAGAPDFQEACSEVDFLSQIFGTRPVERLFLYREPFGWWRSAKIKFGLSDDELREDYVRAFGMYDRVGGVALEYCETLPALLKSFPFMSGVNVDQFSAKKIEVVEAAVGLESVYRHFRDGVSEQAAA